MLHPQPQETLHHDGGLQGALSERVSRAPPERRGGGGRRVSVCTATETKLPLQGPPTVTSEEHKYKQMKGTATWANAHQYNTPVKEG